MKPRIGDVVVIISVALIGMGIWISLARGDQTGDFAQIRVGGEVVQTLDLRGGDYSCDAAGLTFVVSEHRVSVVRADCPDQVCVNTQAIEKPGQTIVCVPNRVSVSVLGGAPVDAITN